MKEEESKSVDVSLSLGREDGKREDDVNQCGGDLCIVSAMQSSYK